MPTLYVIAGPNGVGKTAYETRNLSLNEEPPQY